MYAHVLVFLLLLTQGGERPPRPSNDSARMRQRSFFLRPLSIYLPGNVAFDADRATMLVCTKVCGTRWRWFLCQGCFYKANCLLELLFIKKMAPARTRLVHFRVPTPWLVSNYTISMETGQTYHLGRWLHDDIGFFPLDISVTVSTRQVS
jgi:hypothetical protein